MNNNPAHCDRCRCNAPLFDKSRAWALHRRIAVISAVGSDRRRVPLSVRQPESPGTGLGRLQKRIGGLILEVGTSATTFHRMLAAHGRETLCRIGLDGPWRYNPLPQRPRPPTRRRTGIAAAPERFREGEGSLLAAGVLRPGQVLILLHRVADDYVTLFDIYECAISPTGWLT